MNLNFYSKTIVALASLRKSFVFCLIAAFLFVNNSQAQIATALNFDGENDYVNVPVRPALNISSNITIETWINPTKTWGVQDVFCKSSDASSSGYIFPRTINGWVSIEFLLNINGYGWQVLRVPYGANKRNQWHHVAATYDGFSMKIYIDAVEAGSFSFSGSILVNSNPLSIGYQPGFDDENFGGSLDEARIWNRALSQCEIASKMNCQLAGVQTGLVAYYKFNQGLLGVINPLETTLQDASPTGANGTLNNFGLLNIGLLSQWTSGTVNPNSTCGAFTPTTVTAGSLNAFVPIGGTINLTAVSSPGATYSWIGPNGFTSNLQNPSIVGVGTNASGTYTVTATLNGCSGTANTVITVAPMASGLSFDGANDEVVVPNSPQFNSKEFSIEAWIYPVPGSTVIQNVVSKSSNAVATGYKFPKTQDKWSTFQFELSINNAWVTLSAPIPGSGLNQWNHVAATFDGYFMRIYLNGALVGTQEVNGTVTMNTNNLVIGNQAGRAEFYKGKLDELRIWNRAISQCEIINNMQTCELNGQQNGLANQVALGAYYRFNQGLENIVNTSTNTLIDSSGHANNGALTNFALNGTESNWTDGKVYGTCATYVLPLLTASANGSVFQTGTTAKLFAVHGNNNDYTWAGPNSFSTTTQNPVLNNVQLNQSGVYTVTTPYISCVVTSSTRIKVTNLPQIIANGSTSICPSGSVLLSSASTGTSYQWYMNDVLINGATSLSYLATAAGNYSVIVTNGTEITISAPITVTVIPDNTAPVANVASLPTLNLLAPATVTSIPRATDNCAGVVNGTPDISLTFTQAGNFTITWSYNDNNGNISTQTQNVVVTRPADVTPPIIWAPADINANANTANCGAVVTFAATATDDSGDPVTITYSHNPGTWFPVGRTLITITATDASNNVSTSTFWVIVAPTVVAPVTGVNYVCENGTTTLATASTGGTWTSDDVQIANVNPSTGVVTGVRTGTANIIYTDACGSTAYLAVTVRPLPSSPNVHVVNNCGNSVLTAANVTGTLLWSTGATTASITVSNSGIYSVTQTVNGCTSEPESQEAAPKALPATPIVVVANNCGSTTLTVSNIEGNLMWSNGSNDEPSITVTNSATYTVTQRANGCTSLPGSAVSAPKAIPSAPTVSVANNCGSSTLTASNTTGAILWSNGANTASITVNDNATYTVTQTVNGCTSAAGSGVSAPMVVPSAPIVTVANNCGSSTLTASNTTGSILWSNGATTASITVSNNATYTVTQKVGTCTSAAGSGVSAPVALPATPIVTVVDNCGSSTLTVSNTTGSILWSNGATTASITVSNNATYTVTQTVGNCTSLPGSGVSAPKAIPSAPTVTVNNNCGSSTLTASNTTGTILWSNGANTASITVNDNATYTVTQTVNGCTSAAGSGVSAPMVVPSAPVVTVANNCGSSTLTASNTTGSILWSNGATTASITVSNNATYTVTQKVGNCTSAAGSGVSAPVAPPATPIVTVQDNCGSSTLTVSNATGSIAWSNGATTASITVSNNATYTVTQKVGNCTSLPGSGVSAPKAIPSAPTVTVNNICGSSTLTASNTTGQILWSNNATTASITVSDNATYTVTQNVNGCVSAAGTGTSAPKAIQATPVVVVTNNCGSTTLSTNATGSLSWSNGASSSSITVTSAGNFSVTATNTAGCSATSVVTPVTVNAYPVVAGITGNTTVTAGSSTQLANATGSGVWSSNSANATVNASGLVTGVNAGTATISYTVTSGAGCATTVSTTVTVNALPTCTTPVINAITNVSVNTTSGCTAAATYTATVSGTPAPALSYTFTGATTGSGTGTGSGATFNLGTTTVVITATNTCAVVTRSFTVTVTDATAPVITPVANQTFCGTSGSYTVPALSATDNCSGTITVTYAVTGATSRTGTGNNASGTFNTGTSTITWTVKDARNNTSTSTTTVVVSSGPVATITASATTGDFCSELVLNGSSSVSNASYKWMSGSTIVGTSQQFSLGQSNAEGTYQLYVTANGCTSTAASYTFSKQNLLSSYTILAYDDVHMGKYSKVATGSVGVMSSWGDARFYSNTSVNGPNSFVKSPDIDLNGSNINITRKIYAVASVPVPAMQYNTSNANYYSTYSTSQYSTVTLSSNYKKLTIRKGTYATLSGTIFGTIELEEGASVRFTNATINIEKLLVDDGARDGYYSYVRFAPNSSVRVATQVKIGSQVLVNPDNYKVTFYMGDNSCDEERFIVKGADTKLIANILMPNGKLKVTSTDDDDDYHESCNHQAHSYWNCGHNNKHNHKSCDHRSHSSDDCNDDVYMTGTFIVEDVESKGNTVIWNSFTCGSSSTPVVMNSKINATSTVALTATQEKSAPVTTEEELKITVMPNPSTTYFTLKFESKYETPVNMRVMDANGRVVDAQSKIGSNSTIRIGAGYASGTYYAEMIQGGTRKVIQLLKIK